MTVPSTIDAAAWLGKYLEGDDGDTDLARAMLQAFAETLMSAQARQLRCGLQRAQRGAGPTRATAIGAGPGTPGRARSTWPCRSCEQGVYFPDWLAPAPPAGRTGPGGRDRPGLRGRGVHPPGR